MSRVRRGLSAVLEFIVGDDPWTAVGVAVALGITAVTAVWWILPIAVFALLGVSLARYGS